MASKTICVLGGTGFVGHHLISRLVQEGYQVRVPSRNRERHRSLFVLPGVEVIDTNIFDESALKKILTGCDAVINLCAIINEHKRGDFHRIHVELPARIASACWAASVTRVLHMSALNADAKKGGSAYLRSKGEGEEAIHDSDGLHVTSFRPSVIFGPNDHFFNKFANLLISLPVLALPCQESQFAPVYVGDVVDLMVKSLNDKSSYGQRYEICGPKVYSMLELIRYTARQVNPKRKIIPLSRGISSLLARFTGLLPGKPFSYDNYLSLQIPAVCQGTPPAHFNIRPTPVESVVPYYIGQAAVRGRYDKIRRQAARDPD